jgi:hypothetical protein
VSAQLLLPTLLCGAVLVANAAEPSSAFTKALVAESRSPEISADEDVYAKLLGVWNVQAHDRADDGSFQVTEGEWFFARTLAGRAVQDVWIAPNRYGTSVRTFDPRTRTWQITWFNPVTGAFDVLQTRIDGARIVQEGTHADGRRQRWIFQEITDTTFHWTGEVQLPDGSWQLEAEFFGRRR